IGWALAFGAGVASFFSPCVAPLIPGYLSLVSGVSHDELAAGGRAHTGRVLRASLLFVLGFVVVFVLLGILASLAGGLAGPDRRLVNRVAGILMIAMGLLMLGIVPLPVLSRERRVRLSAASFGRVGPTLLGMAFAFGWTPCVGPILAAILFYAGTTGTVGQGAALLLLYALGLAVPFVATGVGFGRMAGAFGWARRHRRLLNWASGLTLIAMGLLFVTNLFFWLSIATQRLYYALLS
ncbi:MAG: cytochrome c biogenesis protein CcdA, partial [Rhodospirillales bacterium]|nr:cytochrome c biogenesis protein CcdA [Rhodospirillales bacterium]